MKNYPVPMVCTDIMYIYSFESEKQQKKMVLEIYHSRPRLQVHVHHTTFENKFNQNYGTEFKFNFVTLKEINVALLILCDLKTYSMIFPGLRFHSSFCAGWKLIFDYCPKVQYHVPLFRLQPAELPAFRL